MAIKVRMFTNVPDIAEVLLQSVIRSLCDGVSSLRMSEVEDLEAAVERVASGESWRHGNGVIIVVPNANPEEVGSVRAFASRYNGSGGRAWVDVQVFDLKVFDNGED